MIMDLAFDGGGRRTGVARTVAFDVVSTAVFEEFHCSALDRLSDNRNGGAVVLARTG